jgi:hypothetical protein
LPSLVALRQLLGGVAILFPEQRKVAVFQQGANVKHVLRTGDYPSQSRRRRVAYGFELLPGGLRFASHAAKISLSRSASLSVQGAVQPSGVVALQRGPRFALVKKRKHIVFAINVNSNEGVFPNIDDNS